MLGPRRPWTLTLIAAALALLSQACASIPKGMAAVDDVDVEGNDVVAGADIEEKIATTPSKKFLGMFRGVIYDYQLYEPGVLQRDLERVERYYRARGFYQAKARAGRVDYTSDDHVEVTIEVEEGPRTFVQHAQIDGTKGLPVKAQKGVDAALATNLAVGDPFEEEPFAKAETDMKLALTDIGYAWAKIERTADVDLPGHFARVRFTVTPGPLAKFGTVRVEGLKELPADVVLATVDIDPGDPYSTDTIADARRAVMDLGTFSSVDVVPTLTEPIPPDRVVPLVVKVQEQKLRSVLLGGGVQLDSVRAQLHLRVGWEHRNLFGGFRHFAVDLKPELNLYPTRLPSLEAPTTVLPGERFKTSLRQPSFIEARTVGLISQELNTYPVLLAREVDPTAPVIGYLEYKGSAGLERSIWRFFGAPTYNFQYNFPFAYQGTLDPALRGVILSYVSALAHIDLRDDRIRPHKGIYLQNDLQFAGLGGHARDVRIQPEIRGYIPLGKPVTLATRLTVGYLFPLNYGNTATAAAEDGVDTVDRNDWTRDLQIIYLRGFFSGGPSSNRGYPIRGVGPHGVVPFYSPELEADQLAQACDPNSSDFEAARCAVPLGGRSLWELSVELRFPILDPLGGAVFCDASDVAATQLTFRPDYPHLSCGLGLRYDTPIGPIRIDAGYRIPGLQYPADADLILEGNPGTLFGAPIAIAFGLGESF